MDKHNGLSKEDAMLFLENAIEFQELMTKYSSAKREVTTKL